MSATMREATCGKCSARGLTWSRSVGAVVYLSDADGGEHWQTCAGVTAPDDVADAMPATMPTAAPAPVLDAAAAPDDDFDGEAFGAEMDADQLAHDAYAVDAVEVAEWPTLRRAVLAYGGIGPSRDWSRSDYPGDLYRINGKAPDLVAAEVTIGRSDTPPWASPDDGNGTPSDGAMFAYLHRSWEDWQRAQQARRPRPIRPSARSVSEALADRMPAKTGSAGDLRAVVYDVARLVADVADLVAAGKAPADLPRQVADLARTIAEASA